MVDEYRKVKSLILTIDGLQPEKGHETLYVVRELRTQRIWFATPLLSSGVDTRPRDQEAALSSWRKPWGQDGIWAMLQATFRRCKLPRHRLHALRAYFVTGAAVEGAGAGPLSRARP